MTDAEQILAIYRPIVSDTAISFELSVPTIEDMRGRIETTLQTHAWLVAQGPHGIDGYAYASKHRPRQAYQHSVEVSAYVREGCRGQRIATTLYQQLFDALQVREFHFAFAGIALPNESSVALHRSMGFSEIGVFREVGYKFGKWHDVQWWQRKIQP